MIVSISGADIAIRTPFSDTQDLTQVLRGVRKTVSDRNEPVDFRLAGLVNRRHPDVWHVDQVLAFSTDECSPFVMDGEDVGGNHGYPCGMRLRVPAHGLTCRDVGTIFTDDAHVRWTLVRIDSADELLFLADDFPADAVTGLLHRPGDGCALLPKAQHPREQLTPAIRHLRCDVDVLQGGAWQPYSGYTEDAEACRITEVYEVIDPRTVAEALRRGRPADGYPVQPCIAVGEAMAIHRMVYTIQGSGDVLCEFDHEAAGDKPITLYLGVMAQDRCDAFGGGVHRVIHGIKPFEECGHVYDFSRPYPITAGPMPDVHPVRREDWANPDVPPAHQVDVLRRMDGSDAVAFACGFLPLYDGDPAVRARNVGEAWTIVSSRKTYPTFAGSMAGDIPLRRIRGVAYKKFFLPQNGLACDVAYEGTTWRFPRCD